MRIGLTQSNLDAAEAHLLDVADPASPNFGKHWTVQQVHDTFGPTSEAVERVKMWLTDAGIDMSRVTHTDNRGWLAFDATVEEAERLLWTEYHAHHHGAEGSIRYGCDEYYVPREVQEHIDFITPGVQLSPRVRTATFTKRDLARRNMNPPVRRVRLDVMPPATGQPYVAPPQASMLPPQLSDCGQNITPPCIKALYQIPNATTATTGNEMGLYESSDTYAQADLNSFFTRYAPYVPNGTHPLLQSVDGGDAPVKALSQYNTGESDIDMDMAFSLIYPQGVHLFQTDDRHRSNQSAGLSKPTLNGFLNTFLDALDGSYCTYSAYNITGDSPGIDAHYPDHYPAKSSYTGKLECGIYEPTNVISISYGEAEHDLPANYLKRQCNEFMKLGLRGTTVFASSGDYGVAGFPGDDSPRGCLGARGRIFNPQNPVVCPYVTAVGATQLYASQTVLDSESAMHVNLSGTAQNFSSAGGFSNYFPAPSWQQSTVASYFAKYGHTYPYYNGSANFGVGGGLYNAQGRGMPDVAANGAFYRAYTGGIDYHWFGTSLASPLWGSITTLLNEARLAANKSTVGFISPTLYANPSVLNDIVNGTNPGCGTEGFAAVEGWDPITGLGTPSFPRLLKLFMSLP